jgi:hypothetical protein
LFLKVSFLFSAELVSFTDMRGGITLTALLMMSLPILFSSQALWKGQVIKQFFSFSISESLAKYPFRWLSTQLPCAPVRTWVEEPPLFHFLAGLLLKVFPTWSVTLPWVSYSILILSIYLFTRETGQTNRKWITLIGVGLCPIFLRYGIQHLRVGWRPESAAMAYLDQVAGA